MEFMVKLIEVNETKNIEARDSLYRNCTHVARDFWLYEGDMEALNEGIDCILVGEQAIEGTGGLTGSEIKKLVIDLYNIDPCFM